MQHLHIDQYSDDPAYLNEDIFTSYQQQDEGQENEDPKESLNLDSHEEQPLAKVDENLIKQVFQGASQKEHTCLSTDGDDLIGQLGGSDNIEHIGCFTDLFGSG